jgi:hypothetical protein
MRIRQIYRIHPCLIIVNPINPVNQSSDNFMLNIDGGESWTVQTSGTSENINGISFIDANTGTAVGDNGTILRTTNGGINWVMQTSGITNLLVRVSFSDANTGTAVGWGGTILRTTNGGENWIKQSSGTLQNLYTVCFSDANNGTLVGAIGTILHTTNGGENWVSQPGGTTYNINGVSFTDANTGTAVGSYGIILRTTNGGLTFVEEELLNQMPSKFLLSQNYPNPFNPVTKIKYTVPQLSIVTIKVFDILGNEIEVLINEEKPAGIYEIKWNAANLSSGVYLYQLRAGNFIKTNKMILLR